VAARRNHWTPSTSRRLRDAWHITSAPIPSPPTPGRLMRVPGTWNRKAQPRPVEIVSSTPEAFDVRRLVGGLEDPPPRVAAPINPALGNDCLADIPPRAYVERLTGQTPNSRGKVRCPFHDGGAERTPSLHLYTEHWVCFGCHRGGNIYTFASWLWLGQRSVRGEEFKALRRRLLAGRERRALALARPTSGCLTRPVARRTVVGHIQRWPGGARTPPAVAHGGIAP